MKSPDELAAEEWFEKEWLDTLSDGFTLDSKHLKAAFKDGSAHERTRAKELATKAEKVIEQLCANGNLARSFGVDIALLNEVSIQLTRYRGTP
jgi:hypothetical protein